MFYAVKKKSVGGWSPPPLWQTRIKMINKQLELFHNPRHTTYLYFVPDGSNSRPTSCIGTCNLWEMEGSKVPLLTKYVAKNQERMEKNGLNQEKGEKSGRGGKDW